MFEYTRNNEGFLISKVSNFITDVDIVLDTLKSATLAFGFLIKRNTTVTGHEWSDLILAHETCPKTIILANFLQEISKENPKFLTLNRKGDIEFFGFDVTELKSGIILKSYFTIMKKHCFLTLSDFKLEIAK